LEHAVIQGAESIRLEHAVIQSAESIRLEHAVIQGVESIRLEHAVIQGVECIRLEDIIMQGAESHSQPSFEQQLLYIEGICDGLLYLVCKLLDGLGCDLQCAGNCEREGGV
jgi:hypothetical protein